jgi:hypothetical protein
MKSSSIVARCAVVVAALGLLVGCQPQAGGKGSSAYTSGTPGEHDDHGHGDDHGHDHDHGHGPHGGHVLALEPGHVHVEWAHEGKLITVYVDDLAEVPTAVKFVVKAGDAEPQSFDLTKSTSTEADQAAAWTIESDALLTHINMGEATNVQLVVVTGSGELSTRVEHSDEHDHKH